MEGGVVVVDAASAGDDGFALAVADEHQVCFLAADLNVLVVPGGERREEILLRRPSQDFNV